MSSAAVALLVKYIKKLYQMTRQGLYYTASRVNDKVLYKLTATMVIMLAPCGALLLPSTLELIKINQQARLGL